MDVDVLVLYALITFPIAILLVFGFKVLKKIYYVQHSNSMLLEAMHSSDADNAIKILNQIPDTCPLDGANSNGLKLIHQATMMGNTKLISTLLERPTTSKISVNDIVEVNGNSSLHMAALIGKLNVVQTLLDFLADPNLRNSEGWTPLHLACMKGRFQVKKLLLEAGADDTVKTRSGLTCFDLQETEKVHFGHTRH